MIRRGHLFRNLKHDPKNILRLLLLAAVVTIIALPAVAQNSKGDLGVMTYNVNEGTDFLQVLSATNTTEFLLGVGQIVTQVQGTNPPERMQSVAAQILLARPTLVSLQEVDQWYLGTFNPFTQPVEQCPWNMTCCRNSPTHWLRRADITRS